MCDPLFVGRKHTTIFSKSQFVPEYNSSGGNERFYEAWIVDFSRDSFNYCTPRNVIENPEISERTKYAFPAVKAS